MKYKLPDNCACGQPMHVGPGQAFLINHMQERWGEFKKVKLFRGKMYLVPIYYFIIHKLDINQLPHMGFRTIKKGQNENQQLLPLDNS